jgi:hypothetical protein
MDNIDEVIDKILVALGEIEKDKIMVAKAYNKKVKAKLFQVGDLVWKIVLSLRIDRKFSKWSPSWEGPYRITQVITSCKTLNFGVYKFLCSILKIEVLLSFFLTFLFF